MPKSQTIVTVLANGATDAKTYDANGNLSFEQLDFKDGRHEQKSFLLTGAAYTSTDSFYDAQWRITSQTQYKADGTVLDVMARSYATDGSNTTTHTDAKGQLTSKEVAKADGTHIQTTYLITNKPYVTQEVTLDVKWRITKLVLINGDGSLYGSQIYSYAANGDIDIRYVDGKGLQFLEQIDRANGTHAQITKAATGLAYSTQQNEFDKNWVLIKQIHLTAAGAVLETLSWSTDAAGTVSTIVTDAAGKTTLIDKLFVDKHHEVSTFGITGQAYTSQVQSFSAAWQLNAQSLLDAKGMVLEYDSFKYSAAGHMIFEQQDFADGHHLQTSHEVTGQAYSDAVMTFDAAWNLTKMTLTKPDGSLYANVIGRVLADGSKELKYYDARGALFLDQFDKKDGSHIQLGTTATGLFHAYEYDFDQNWKLTQSVQNNNNGTNTVTGYGSGLTLHSTGLGNDFMTGGGSNETFVFGLDFGRETITDFIAEGSGHDLISVNHTLVSDWTHLLADMRQVGGDVQITLNPNNIITLQHMTIAQLHANDFIFA